MLRASTRLIGASFALWLLIACGGPPLVGSDADEGTPVDEAAGSAAGGATGAGSTDGANSTATDGQGTGTDSSQGSATGDSTATDEIGTTDCPAGFADCDGIDTNGCEMSISADVTNCGGCGKTCVGEGRGTAQCANGHCRMACEIDFSDCDGNLSNGCEVDVRSSADHCGLCGNSCGEGTCVDGACSCAGTFEEGKFTPVDLYLLIDRSGSMYFSVRDTEEFVNTGNYLDVSRWALIRTALVNFFRDPSSVGLTLGMSFFPSRTALNIPAGCTAQYDPSEPGFAGSALTPIELLEGSDKANDLPMTAVLNQNTPFTDNLKWAGTPTEVALPAMLSFLKRRAQDPALAGRKQAVVLVTDGVPSVCDGVVSGQLVDKVREAHAAGVDTFVVGVSRSVSGMQLLTDLATVGSDSIRTAFTVDGTGAYLTVPFVMPSPDAVVSVSVNVTDSLEPGMPVWLAETATAFVVETKSPLKLRRVSTSGTAAGTTIGRLIAGVSGAAAPVGNWYSPETDSITDPALAASLPVIARAEPFRVAAQNNGFKLKFDDTSMTTTGRVLYMPAAKALFAVSGHYPDPTEVALQRLSSFGVPAGTVLDGATVPGGLTVHDVTMGIDTMMPVITTVDVDAMGKRPDCAATDTTIVLKSPSGLAPDDQVYIDACWGVYRITSLDMVQRTAALHLEDRISTSAATSSGPVRVYRGSPRDPPTSPGGGQALVAALRKIQGSLIGCSYAPPEGDSASVDYEKVNIDLSLDDVSVPLSRVEDLAACGDDDEAWYYEFEGGAVSAPKPEWMKLCPATCSRLTNAHRTAVDIQVGCTSRTVSSRD